MKKFRNSLTVVIALALFISIGTPVISAKKDSNTQRYAWPLATSSTTDTITHIFATIFAEEVYNLSNGTMKIQVYSQSTLGGDRELLESCKDGDIPFVLQSPAPQVAFMPQLSVLDTPCVFDSIQDVRHTIDNKQFNSILKKVYSNAGYQLLGIADQGFRVMTSKEKFIDFSSFKGQKIRTMENANHIQFWKGLKSNPTPMSFSEVYIALQQSTIDAQENAYEIIVSAKLYEQQKYVMETNAVPDLTTLIVSQEFYKDLTDKEQSIIQKAAIIAQNKSRNEADHRIEMRKQQLNNEGLEFIKLNDEIRLKMKEASKPVYENIRKQAGDELFDLYIKK